VTKTKQEPTQKPPRDFLERMAPNDMQSETALLGSLLLKPDVIDEVMSVVRVDDFYDVTNGIMFETMREMHVSGKRIDIALLVSRLKKDKQLDAVGGVTRLSEITQSVPNAANAVYYAQLIREASVRRKLISASVDIAGIAYDGNVECDQMIAKAEALVMEVGAANVTAERCVSIRDVVMESLTAIETRQKDGRVAGVQTGFTSLDETLGGMLPGQLIIVAGRTSMGKTSLAVNIATNVASHATPVLIVSLEMTRSEIVERIMCSVGEVSTYKVRNGLINGEERRRLVEVSASIARMPMWIDDAPTRGVSEIGSLARRMKRRDGLGLIVVDYLQIVSPESNSSRTPRQEQVARISAGLKALARELHVPVVCLAQLNRQPDSMADRKPRLSHLRESGSIEQDADVVLFVHRDAYYLTQSDASGEMPDPKSALIVVAKQRNGPTRECSVIWEGDYTTFRDDDTRSSQKTLGYE
jgi:replicative DNA helicase